INAPTSQSMLNYVLLALIYGGIMIYRRQALALRTLALIVLILQLIGCVIGFLIAMTVFICC
ncbi:unnamed protein product, partial [Ilex paraguariensis]